MKLRPSPFRNVLVASLVVATATSAAANPFCILSLRSHREIATETAESFAARKRRWAEPGLRADRLPSDPYDLLAYIEVVGERDGFDALRISETLEKGTAVERERILRAVGRLKRKRRLTRAELGRFATELYLAANPAWQDLPVPGFVRRRIPVGFERHVLRRIDIDLATKSLEEAFREIGFLRNPRFFGHFKRWKADHPVLFDSIRVTAWNAFWIATFGVPGTLPKAQFAKLRSLTDDLAARYKIVHPRQFADLPPDLRKEILKQYGVVGRIDVGVAAFRIAYSTAAIAFLVYYLTDEDTRRQFAALWSLFRMASITDEELKEHQARTFDCDAQKRRLWEGFREGFKDLSGRHPDPSTHPEDAETYESNRARILDADCESLKVKFE